MKKYPKQNKERIAVTIDPQNLRKLKEIKAEQGLSVSWQVNRSISKYFDSLINKKIYIHTNK